MPESRFREFDPLYLTREALRVVGRALTRMWGRDVMLYTGGVSFFVMLAVFPGLAIAIGLYSLLTDPTQVAHQMEGLTTVIPVAAQGIVTEEMARLARTPDVAVSAQSLLAIIIGGYAAHRGFKALLAGLSFIHDEDNPHGFFAFNLMALVVLVAAMVLAGAVATGFIVFRVLAETLNLKPLAGIPWLFSEWTWTTAGLILAITLIYRFAMSREPVAWRASTVGGAAATGLFLFASWLCAIYVDDIVELGATYGSVATVVIFLIWLSWSVNAFFFGGALATEVEIALKAARPKLIQDLRGERPISAGPGS
ncbi:MAG TPA: YihY/virulence factor BrkB family protein [Caulobacteraceae bacterium]